jgi:hypothetical protein
MGVWRVAFSGRAPRESSALSPFLSLPPGLLERVGALTWHHLGLTTQHARAVEMARRRGALLSLVTCTAQLFQVRTEVESCPAAYSDGLDERRSRS